MLLRTRPDTKFRQVLIKTNLAAPRIPAPPTLLPVKMSRARSNSTSMTSPPVTTRKRTSSGVFQVDESEPQPKPCRKNTDIDKQNSGNKTESVKTTDGVDKKKEIVEKEKDIVEKKKDIVEKKKDIVENKKEIEEKKDKIIDKFDSEAKSNCVTAFKESYSWD